MLPVRFYAYSLLNMFLQFLDYFEHVFKMQTPLFPLLCYTVFFFFVCVFVLLLLISTKKGTHWFEFIQMISLALQNYTNSLCTEQKCNAFYGNVITVVQLPMKTQMGLLVKCVGIALMIHNRHRMKTIKYNNNWQIILLYIGSYCYTLHTHMYLCYTAAGYSVTPLTIAPLK